MRRLALTAYGDEQIGRQACLFVAGELDPLGRNGRQGFRGQQHTAPSNDLPRRQGGLGLLAHEQALRHFGGIREIRHVKGQDL